MELLGRMVVLGRMVGRECMKLREDTPRGRMMRLGLMEVLGRLGLGLMVGLGRQGLTGRLGGQGRLGPGRLGLGGAGGLGDMFLGGHRSRRGR
jgi:hypothetical protein